ncbi:MAG: endonuclease III domain-containing protein [Candidatus Caldatribacteriota bacterium]
MKKQIQNLLLKIYQSLYDYFGPLNWWPGDTTWEIVVGAVLTQNTNWNNVVKAIQNLKRENLLKPDALYKVEENRLADLIKPSGYYNIKTKRLKNLVNFVFDEYQGSEDLMFKEESVILREKLLSIKGIGPETADSILLYAGNKPFFVVDAYTRRIFSRHKLIPKGATYKQIQDFFSLNLEPEVALFNEFHAQIVMLGKTVCKNNQPNCVVCPLKFLKEEKSLSTINELIR